MTKYRPLSVKITFFCTTIIIIASAIITLIVYSTTSQFFQRLTTENLQQEARLVANNIQYSLLKVANDLTILSKTPPIQGLIRSTEAGGKDIQDFSDTTIWKNRLSTIFTSFLNVNPQYTQIRYILANKKGQELVRVDRIQGDIFTVHDSALQGKANTHYFQNAIKLSHGSVYFSKITYNEEHGKITLPKIPTLRVILPIYTPKQQLFGLLVINVNFPHYLQSNLLRQRNTRNIILTDQHGDTLTYDANSRLVTFFDNAEKQPIEMFDKAFNNPKDLLRYITTNPNYVTANEPIYSSVYKDSQIFELYIPVPKAMLFKEDVSLVHQVIFAIFLITLITAICIFLFSSYILSHLREMAKSISASLPKDQETQKLPIHLNDEVGLLARAFEEKSKLLTQLARFDSLTGLPNRKALHDHLVSAIHRTIRNKTLLGVIFIDINDFKSINDSYGHDTGDALLVAFSDVLKRNARKTDFCSRLSGDEFVIVLEGIESPEHFNTVREKLFGTLNTTYEVRGITLHVTISAGLAICPSDSEEASELLTLADHAMYRSKQEGLGKVHTVTPGSLNPKDTLPDD